MRAPIRSSFNSRPENFTAKGRFHVATFRNGKKVNVKVVKCSGEFADVEANGKRYLMSSDFVIVR
jgi:hypothetical protein